MDRETFYQMVGEFLRESNPQLGGLTPGPHEHLVDAGFLDSYRMVELIVFIEGTVGIEIPLEDHDPRSFYTMERMYRTLVSDGATEASDQEAG